MSHRATSVTKPNALVLIIGICLLVSLLGWYVHHQYQTELRLEAERMHQN